MSRQLLAQRGLQHGSAASQQSELALQHCQRAALPARSTAGRAALPRAQHCRCTALPVAQHCRVHSTAGTASTAGAHNCQGLTVEKLQKALEMPNNRPLLDHMVM